MASQNKWRKISESSLKINDVKIGSEKEAETRMEIGLGEFVTQLSQIKCRFFCQSSLKINVGMEEIEVRR